MPRIARIRLGCVAKHVTQGTRHLFQRQQTENASTIIRGLQASHRRPSRDESLLSGAAAHEKVVSSRIRGKPAVAALKFPHKKKPWDRSDGRCCNCEGREKQDAAQASMTALRPARAAERGTSHEDFGACKTGDRLQR